MAKNVQPLCHAPASSSPLTENLFIALDRKSLHVKTALVLNSRLVGKKTGDIATGTGAGGESIWGKKFKDDKVVLIYIYMFGDIRMLYL